MISYDKRRYYNRNWEPFFDPEWEEAASADEKSRYYWMRYAGGEYVRKYKPSVMELVKKRTGCEFVPVKGDAE